MTADRWTADVNAHQRVAAFSRVNLRGPELDEFALDLVERLATVLFDEFCEYVAARNALKLALAENGGASDYDLERVVRTQDDLMSEIDTGLRLSQAESRIVAGVLDEACGRVGIQKEKA
jgi:hypothetical protein